MLHNIFLYIILGPPQKTNGATLPPAGWLVTLRYDLRIYDLMYIV